MKGEIFNSPPAVSREKSFGEQTPNFLESFTLNALVQTWSLSVDCFLLHSHFCQLCHLDKGGTKLKKCM